MVKSLSARDIRLPGAGGLEQLLDRGSFNVTPSLVTNLNGSGTFILSSNLMLNGVRIGTYTRAYACGKLLSSDYYGVLPGHKDEEGKPVEVHLRLSPREGRMDRYKNSIPFETTFD